MPVCEVEHVDSVLTPAAVAFAEDLTRWHRGWTRNTRVRAEAGATRFDRGHFPEARRLFDQVATTDELEEFLTIPAYDVLEKASN
jgi:hypothetical protein